MIRSRVIFLIASLLAVATVSFAEPTDWMNEGFRYGYDCNVLPARGYGNHGSPQPDRLNAILDRMSYSDHSMMHKRMFSVWLDRDYRSLCIFSIRAERRGEEPEERQRERKEGEKRASTTFSNSDGIAVRTGVCPGSTNSMTVTLGARGAYIIIADAPVAFSNSPDSCVNRQWTTVGCHLSVRLSPSHVLTFQGQSCDPSSLGYKCSQVFGDITLHWTTGPDVPLPDNVCTADAAVQEQVGNPSATGSLSHYAVEADVEGYVSLSFGLKAGVMPGNWAIFGWVDSNSMPFLQHCYFNQDDLTDQDVIPPFTSNNGVVRTANGSIILCFTRTDKILQPSRRLLQNNPVPTIDVTQDIIFNWAVNPVAVIEHHTSAGGFTLNLASGVSYAAATKEKWIIIHGALMAVAFFFFFPMGILMARHRALYTAPESSAAWWLKFHLNLHLCAAACFVSAIPPRALLIGGSSSIGSSTYVLLLALSLQSALYTSPKSSAAWWLKFHWILHLCAAACFISTIVIAFTKLDANPAVYGTKGEVHKILGIICLALLLFQLVIGFWRPALGRTTFRKVWTLGHFWNGRVLVLSGIAVSFIGVSMYTDNYARPTSDCFPMRLPDSGYVLLLTTASQCVSMRLTAYDCFSIKSLDETQFPFVATRPSPQRRYVNYCYVRLPLPRTVLILQSTIEESKSDLQASALCVPAYDYREGLPVIPTRSALSGSEPYLNFRIRTPTMHPPCTPPTPPRLQHIYSSPAHTAFSNTFLSSTIPFNLQPRQTTSSMIKRHFLPNGVHHKQIRNQSQTSSLHVHGDGV
eukprot:gene27769-7409_t